MSLLDKASLIQIPSGYKNGKLYSVKPTPTYGSELVTNGDFASSSNWNFVGDGSISNGELILPCCIFNNRVSQSVGMNSTKLYKLEINITQITNGDSIDYLQGGAWHIFGTQLGINTVTISNPTDANLYLRNNNGAATIKIDNVSVKEITNIGDFDFSRSSSGTRVNSEGLIETASVLADIYSSDFSSSLDGWTAFGLGNVAENISIGGEDNSLRYTVTTAIGDTRAFLRLNSKTIGKKYKLTFSYYIPSTNENLNSIFSDENEIRHSTLDSWTTVTEYFTSAVTDIKLIVGDADKYLNPAATGETAYIKNVSLKEVFENDVPRLDYSASCASLLLEPQSTNTVTYSENFSQWGESGSPTLTIGQLAPDGTLGATKISGTIGSSYIALGSSSSTTATRSIYARTVSGTGTAKLMSYSGNTNNLFTLTEEWQRFELTGSSSVGGTSFYIDLRDSSQTLNEFIVWGAQSEELSYATSYIPSNSGSSVTRNQDTCSITNIADRINSSEGVLFGEIAALAENEGNRCITISANSSNKVMLRFATLNRVQVFVIANGTLVSNELHTLTNITNFNKIAFKYKSGNNELFVNGVKVDDNTDTFTFTSSLSEINFDEDGGSPFYGKTKQIQYYNTALTDQELITLTTL